MKKVALGGTFDRFHKGHMRLIRRAFEISDYVLIGVTTDEFARRLGKSDLEPYEKRKKNVEDFVKKEFPESRVEIRPLNDPYGPILKDGSIEGLVVSPETLRRGYEAASLRERAGLPPLDLYIVPFELAEDGLIISSTRIRRGEITPEGKTFYKKRREG